MSRIPFIEARFHDPEETEHSIEARFLRFLRLRRSPGTLADAPASDSALADTGRRPDRRGHLPKQVQQGVRGKCSGDGGEAAMKDTDGGHCGHSDAAATLIANAVNLPGHAAVHREPANTLSPDSDLGERLVVRGVGRLTTGETAEALDRGLHAAETMRRDGLIAAAALFLNGDHRLSGDWPLDQPALPAG